MLVPLFLFSSSVVSTLCNPMNCGLPGSSVCGISRWGYWRRLPFPSPHDLPNPETESISPALQADSLTLSHTFIFGEGNGTPLQYSCLENPMNGGAWWAVVHGVTESQPRLSNFTFTFHFPALEKEMATHSSVLAWRIAGMGEPGGLPSMGSHRVRHDEETWQQQHTFILVWH